ncbi:class I SAM-dependent methyltransferase [Dictyobacter aurantiacus]|uniref:Methyltransferase type 11 n=1 Tax=Dictyobacter aurantiacus TaxID=1936993 RepID=A0A401ZJ21_9CHLR|nr:class I SAM-dependent methyltransferase [Dictyobacter aurantiacus]GCE06842.1 methyltransferase type 11 [Dictyobacter aurantiacus]
MGETPWYEKFFNEDYARLYAPFLLPASTEQDVTDIIRLLDLQPEHSVLDLCCGYGRHALELARYGCQVTGQDLSPRLLERAQASASEQQLQVRWLQGDMRTIPFENEFDAIINMFTSFGYFDSDEEDQKVLQQVHKALKPGGFFLLETIHQARVARTSAPQGIIRYPDGLIVLEERQLDLFSSHNNVRISLLYPDGRRSEHRQSIRVYTLTELAHMLRQAGLELTTYYGGLDGSALTIESRLVLICQKP